MFFAALRQAIQLIFSGDTTLWQIVSLSLLVSGVALILSGLLGIPLGAWLGLRQFRGQRWLTAVIYTGMGLPPVVVGLVVYLLLSRQGLLGGIEWLFQPQAMILAQTILALPLVTGVTMTAVRSVSIDLRPQLQSLGATDWQIAHTILLSLAFIANAIAVRFQVGD